MALRAQGRSRGCARARICQAATIGEPRSRSVPSLIREQDLPVDERGDPSEGFTESFSPFAVVGLEVGTNEHLVTFLSEAEEELLAIRDLGPAARRDIKQLGEMPGVGEGVSRFGRRHICSVAPLGAGATPEPDQEHVGDTVEHRWNTGLDNSANLWQPTVAQVWAIQPLEVGGDHALRRSATPRCR